MGSLPVSAAAAAGVAAGFVLLVLRYRGIGAQPEQARADDRQVAIAARPISKSKHH